MKSIPPHRPPPHVETQTHSSLGKNRIVMQSGRIAPSPVKLGDSVPAFELHDENGRIHDIRDYAPARTVLFFFPTDLKIYITDFFAYLKENEAKAKALDFYRIYILEGTANAANALRDEMDANVIWADEAGALMDALGIRSDLRIRPMSVVLTPDLKVHSMFNCNNPINNLADVFRAVETIPARPSSLTPAKPQPQPAVVETPKPTVKTLGKKILMTFPPAESFQPVGDALSMSTSFNPQLLTPHNTTHPMRRIVEGIPSGMLVIENYLPPESCKVLCDYADQTIGSKLGIVDTNDKKATGRLSETRVTEYVTINKKAGDVLSIFMDIYTRRLAPFYGANFEWFERPQILRYLPGGKYHRHADAENLDNTTNKWVRVMDRDYSVLLYLNEEYEGGALHFPNFDFKMKPKTGMLVAFPADNRYLHAAEETTSGKRYAIVSWAATLGSPRAKDKPSFGVTTLTSPYEH